MLPESSDWGVVDWVQQCVERPEIVMLGANEENGGAVYGVIDMKASRVLDCDEFSAEDTDRLDWKTLEPAENVA